ncbi:uncharacterized protein [Euphorbia lathyris]|uniref:uncharacterized protein n=1 Tax=Euphorbia lathyris TaxID=212925 RepID=UPI0033143410
MNEANGNAAPCMAITEKKPRRPGGCVGIFFQLFDWNRRFAKKKIFSRKLLPPVRAKQATKKFGGDEKMPKMKPHLIADENSGGFPNVRKNGNGSDCTDQKHEMRAAGLVVRLMGLESLPAVNRDKHKKGSNATKCDVKEDKFFNNHNVSDIEVLNSEKGSIKVESRPQKLQKTGQFDRRAVTRFGTEALQIRNVLSRSRKHHHSKLASPVKSPRISSSRNVSRTCRLIGAATRILEPGLHATNRAKCALSYTNSMNYTPNNEVLMDGIGLGAMAADLGNQQDNAVNYDISVAKSFTGQNSCKNCGNLLETKNFPQTMEERVLGSPFSAEKMSLQGSERIKPRPTVSALEQEEPEVHRRNLVVLSSTAGRFDNKRACNESMLDGKPVSMEDQVQQQFKSQQHKPQKDDTTSTAFQQRIDTRTVMSVDRSRIPPKAKLSNLQSRRTCSTGNAISEAKDFVALNRSLSSRSSLPRVSSKVDNCTSNTERKFCSRRDDSLSQVRTPVHKRRTVGVNPQLESTVVVKSKPVRPKNIKCDLVGGKRLEPNARSVDRECIKAKTATQGASNKASAYKDHNVVSFTFNLPVRHNFFISSGLNGTRDHIDKNACCQNGLLPEETDGKTFSQKQMPSNEDSLGALLELKLKELTSQEEDELTVGGAAPKRSTAVILQELISALTAQQPFSPNSSMFNVEKALQTGGRARTAPVGFSHDGVRLSPGSVLEASFSNESCLSSSLDDCSGRTLLYDSMDYSYDQLHPLETDVDLLDSATSVNEGSVGRKIVTDLLNRISMALQSIHLASGGLMGSRFNYVKEVTLNAELLFSSAALQNSDRMKSFLIGPFLFDNLEVLVAAMWTNFECLVGFEDSKDGTRVKRFSIDCLIEYLDSKYGKYCNSGFQAWRRVQLCKNTEMLIEEVVEEVRRWTNFDGMIPDEIIEWEMSHSLGKWTNFEIEEFETGAEIDWEILQVLVDETVMELWDCRLGFF